VIELRRFPVQSKTYLWNNKPIRAAWEITSQHWWFSVIDICAAIRGDDHKTAKNYWSTLKNRLILEGNQLVTKCDQLKLQSKDGKHYFTDVMTIEDVLYLIQILPGRKAEPFRLWLADIAAKDTTLRNEFAEMGALNFPNKSREEIEGNTMGRASVRKTTTRREIPV
jgi:hypothetical protein